MNGELHNRRAVVLAQQAGARKSQQNVNEERDSILLEASSTNAMP